MSHAANSMLIPQFTQGKSLCSRYTRVSGLIKYTQNLGQHPKSLGLWLDARGWMLKSSPELGLTSFPYSWSTFYKAAHGTIRS